MHQSIPAAHNRPRRDSAAFARLVSPGSGGGALANFALPGDGHLPTPGPLPSF